MKKLNIILFIAIIFLQWNCKPDENENPYVYGEITVAMDANKTHLRSQESLLGNLVCDAFKEYAVYKGNSDIDFAIMNAGGIRFNEDVHPDGIYPAGQCDSAMVNEIFPWLDAVSSIVEATGSEIISGFERSVSSLPSEYKGWFLQVSKEVQVEFDLSKQAQVIADATTTTEAYIVTEGERVVSVKINGILIDTSATYKFTVPRWIANGNDGFVAFGKIPAERKTLIYNCEDCEMDREALIYYLKEHTPVTPVIEGRIVF